MSDFSAPFSSLGMSLTMPSNISVPGLDFQPSSALTDAHIVTLDVHIANFDLDTLDLPSSLTSQLANNSSGTLAGFLERSTADDLAVARLAIASLTRERDCLIDASCGTLVAMPVVLVSSSFSAPVLPPHPISPGVVPPPALACTKIYTTQDPSFLPEFWPQVTIHKEIYTLLTQGF